MPIYFFNFKKCKVFKKNKSILFLLTISLMSSSCGFKKVDPVYEFLNQTLLTVFDNIVQEIPKSKKYCLNVSRSLLNLDDIISGIKHQVYTDSSLKEFHTILDLDAKDSVLDVNKIINIGQYDIKHIDSKDCTAIEGQISFYRPLISENLAILPMLKWDNERSGYATAFYFKKVNGKWVFIKEALLFIS